MSVIQIQGMQCLKGTICIQGSKNAVLPVMAASLLHKGTTVLTNVPRIQDVFCMMGILKSLGCECSLRENCLTIDASEARSVPVPEELAGRMRSSIMLLGPLLGRFGRAETTHPGGCSIGSRPIDLHLAGLRGLGAEVVQEEDQIRVTADRLSGGELSLSYPSVGATENLVMAAAAARGRTVLRGAAKEPEVGILCRYLKMAGIPIQGVGTDTLVIEGGRPLRDVSFDIPGDRIVAGTYLAAVMSAGGEVMLSGAPAGHMREALRLASEMGAELSITPEGVLVRMDGRPRAAEFSTGPYPEFPTDLQSVMMAAAAVARGQSRIRENVFEDRFSTAEELRKLGAHIIIDKRTAFVEGCYPLHGGIAEARDLRGGAALVVAGLAAEKMTQVGGYDHIGRGYEDICRDLRGVGARIELAD